MDIENRLEIIELIDAYGNLLKENQISYLQSYYFDNLTIIEIGENLGITRQAVSGKINELVKKLKKYEEKIGLIKKKNLILEKLEKNQIQKNMITEIKNIMESENGAF